MYELIYCSLANQNLTSVDINDILNTARDFNLKNDITGCLLYHNHEFIQILEGDKKIVDDLYANIVKDKRHSNVTLIAKGNKDERSFNSWSMAFYEFSDHDDIIAKELFVNNLLTFSEMTKSPTFAMELFWNKVKKILKKDMLA